MIYCRLYHPCYLFFADYVLVEYKEKERPRKGDNNVFFFCVVFIAVAISSNNVTLFAKKEPSKDMSDQSFVDELANRDWRVINFGREKVIRLTRKNYILMCVMGNDADGTCQYALCEGCYLEHKPKKRCSADPLEERRRFCHHAMRNLEQVFDVWWCTTKNIQGPEWKKRAKGCACCKGMFEVVNS